MGLCGTEAVVLRAYPLGNADQIVVAYTRAYGKLRGVGQGARRLKSPFAGRFEPFNWLELIFFEKEGQELVRIEKVELIKAFGSKLTDYRSFLHLSFLAEILLETTPDREPNDPLFRLLQLVLEEMQNPARSELAKLYFQVWYLKLSGLFPASKSCSFCGLPLLDVSLVFYAADLQCFSCPFCKRGDCHPVTAESFQMLDMIVKKQLKMIEWKEVDCILYMDLQRIIDRMLQHNFERDFESLKLLREAAKFT